MIRVTGIDQDEEPQDMAVDGATARYLACALCRLGWRWLLLEQDGHPVGGIRLDTGLLRRVPWFEAETEEGEAA